MHSAKEMEYTTLFSLCINPSFSSVLENPFGTATSIIGNSVCNLSDAAISIIVASIPCFLYARVSSSTTISVAAPILAGIGVYPVAIS